MIAVMPITSVLHLKLKGDDLEQAYAVVHATLDDSRAFPGCEGLDVFVNADDPTHLIVLERWESEEDDVAYHEWRQTPQGVSDLGRFLDGPSSISRVSFAADI
ncbi:MAG TPA: antibiotic biosynthesis monooxygenase family protein [Jatrophihabitans sp.]|jgi:quinol monooxygenase YgiN